MHDLHYREHRPNPEFRGTTLRAVNFRSKTPHPRVEVEVSSDRLVVEFVLGWFTQAVEDSIPQNGEPL
jgi:hypothetical protein